MKLGIFVKTFAGKTPFDILNSVRDAGYRTAHYNMVCSGLDPMPAMIEPSVARAVAAAARESAVEIVSVSGTYNMIHPDRAVRTRGHQRLRVLAAACAGMGVRLISLCTGTRDPNDQWKHHPDNQSPEAWRDLLESMTTAVEVADEFDVELGIEPELANVINGAAAAHRLIEELASPRLRVILDPANLFDVAPLDRQRDIIAAAIDLLADRIAMAHAKDRVADGAFTTAGQGVVDFSHFLRRLRATGFDGAIVAHGLPAADAPAVAKFLQTTMENTQ